MNKCEEEKENIAQAEQPKTKGRHINFSFYMF
jgi:hypothetical protein